MYRLSAFIVNLAGLHPAHYASYQQPHIPHWRPPAVRSVNSSIASRHKIGLVGRNGAGKTTLLKLALGELQPESGTITVPSRARIGSVAQEAPGVPLH